MGNLSEPPNTDQMRVGYIVKRYPRYSETFIVNEILSHESAGLPIEIFSLRSPVDTHFQDAISNVRAAVHYLHRGSSKLSEFWRILKSSADQHPGVLTRLPCMLQLDPNDVLAALSLADHAIKFGITHFHAHFASSPADVAWLVNQLTGIPYTLTAHAKDIFHEDVDDFTLSRNISGAQATITVSDFNVEYLKQKHGAAADRVLRIYNGVDLSAFPFNETIERPPTIVAVGRLVEKKGFRFLLDACAALASLDCQFDCQIIGDGPLSGELRRQCTSLGLGQRVRFLGPQPQSVVKAALRDASAFVAPCVHGSDGNRDGLPTVLLEAMALGTPCISTPVTGIPEVLLNEQTGLLVPECDSIGIADAVQKLIADAAYRSSLARAARQRIEHYFDIHKNTALQRELFSASRDQFEAVADPIGEEVEV